MKTTITISNVGQNGNRPNFEKEKSDRLLVSFQFGISIFLIICTIILNKQINFICNESFGLNRDKVVSFTSNKQLNEHREAFRSEIEGHTEIESLTFTNCLPINIQSATDGLWWTGKDVESGTYFKYLNADIGVVETLGLKLISGTSFKQHTGSRNMIILNRKAAELTGLDNPVGSKFKNGETEVEVVGIIENFQTNFALAGLQPLFINYKPQSTSFGILKLKAGNTTEGIKVAQAAFKKFVPDFPFDYRFLDDDFERINMVVLLSKKISLVAAILAIVLACLGLFGLSISSFELRIKEIGIRKVNGASFGELLVMLNKSYIKWIAVSFTCVSPLAWLLMDKYLDAYAFRINLSWWIFALAGLLALGIALLTVSWQSWRAATRNPVEALRYE